MIQERLVQRGFTLVEMLVSLALFTIVATISVGTLLVLINGNGRVVDEQAGMTALTFALDSMTREIRTGSFYYCGSASQVRSLRGNSTSTNDCTSGADGISFREAGGSITGSTGGRIAYFKDGSVLKRVVCNPICQSLDDAEVIIPDDITLQEARFMVTGSGNLRNSNNRVQPTISILLTASTNMDTPANDFIVQTTVTQRTLDI